MGLPGQSAQQQASERGYPNSNIRWHLRNASQGLRLTLTLTHVCVYAHSHTAVSHQRHTERGRKIHASILQRPWWLWVKARKDSNQGARGSKNNDFIRQKLRNIKSFRSLSLKELVPEPWDNNFLSCMIFLWWGSSRGNTLKHTEKVRESPPWLELKRGCIVAHSLCEAKRQCTSWNRKWKCWHCEPISVLEWIFFFLSSLGYTTTGENFLRWSWEHRTLVFGSSLCGVALSKC